LSGKCINRLGTRVVHFVIFVVVINAIFGCSKDRLNNDDDGPSPELTPEEELATFQLPSDLQIQLVAAEPMVQDPVVILFDPDGRLWVVEMRGFMPDIDGKGENQPVGRVSILEDTNADGKMDVGSVYIDSLIMPRALALVPGGALVVENQSLWLTQDMDGDFKADTKTLIDSTYAGNPSVEHSGNGLWRNTDNWYYNAKSRLRYRLVNNRWIRDSTEFRGQWGLSHDDEGRLYYNYNWSQLHADLVPPNYFSRNKNHTATTGIDHGLTLDRRIYPIRPNPAVNRGYIPGTLDEDSSLLEFTAACSPLYYRGTALPKEYYGNVFVCEPSGNLVKRNVVHDVGLTLKANDPTPGKEFLASTDERFRPVFLASGPDGALYIADMYRGLIQHGLYVTPYLREQTLKRKLVVPINRGRIWRIVPKGWKAPEQPKLSDASAERLVKTLAHPNGWYRDVAQRLLVERNDKSVEDTLKKLILKGDQQLARFHALWTLEGMNLTQPELLFQLLDDNNTLMRTTALRLLEPFAERDRNVRQKLGQQLSTIWNSAPIEQILQISLGAHTLDSKMSHLLLANIADRYDTSALIRDAVMSSLGNQEFEFLTVLWNAPLWQTPTPGKEIFLETLTTSIVKKRSSNELSSLLSMLDGAAKTSWKKNSVLTGLSVQGRSKVKPIQLSSAPRILTTNKTNIEQVRILSAMFEWPGHVADTTSTNRENPLNKDGQKQFVAGRQLYLTTCAGCHGSDGEGLNRFAPPLRGSDWVLGDEKRLALILLHGMEGPVEVNGKLYDAPEILPVMPSHSPMDDAAIASIMTYIRNEWGNTAGAVTRRTVGMTRVTSQGRVVPWTAQELNKHVEILRTKEEKSK
jgi:mono/diheme cytochrome c family protein/glucose/arabinose dehydrogenase